MTQTTAMLIGAIAMATLPAVTAPVAAADICGDIGGRYVNVGGCTPGIVGGVADAAIAGAAVAGAADWARYGFDRAYPFSIVPSFPGEQPCISPAGLPYYTPGNAPCYP